MEPIDDILSNNRFSEITQRGEVKIFQHCDFLGTTIETHQGQFTLFTPQMGEVKEFDLNLQSFEYDIPISKVLGLIVGNLYKTSRLKKPNRKTDD
jgi:hypothetical protein